MNVQLIKSAWHFNRTLLTDVQTAESGIQFDLKRHRRGRGKYVPAVHVVLSTLCRKSRVSCCFGLVVWSYHFESRHQPNYLIRFLGSSIFLDNSRDNKCKDVMTTGLHILTFSPFMITCTFLSIPLIFCKPTNTSIEELRQ